MYKESDRPKMTIPEAKATWRSHMETLRSKHLSDRTPDTRQRRKESCRWFYPGCFDSVLAVESSQLRAQAWWVRRSQTHHLYPNSWPTESESLIKRVLPCTTMFWRRFLCCKRYEGTCSLELGEDPVGTGAGAAASLWDARSSCWGIPSANCTSCYFMGSGSPLQNHCVHSVISVSF